MCTTSSSASRSARYWLEAGSRSFKHHDQTKSTALMKSARRMRQRGTLFLLQASVGALDDCRSRLCPIASTCAVVVPHCAHVVRFRYIFRAITLHLLWTQRNEYVFNGHRPRPLVQHVIKLYSTFAAHLRHVRQVGRFNATALERIIAILRTSGTFSSPLRHP